MGDWNWNPWHGCKKISAGCAHCYVFRMDARYGKDSSLVVRNASFRLPVERNRDGIYKIPPGEEVATCFTSDFFVAEADAWRPEAWRIMAQRKDLRFLMITKRIDRFSVGLPSDWGQGYENVTVCCTVENQAMADARLPIYLDAPIAHKAIICEPLLGEIDLSDYLHDGIDLVSVGGESGEEARVCDYAWVLSIREQCRQAGIPFRFRQTGARLLKDGKLYRIRRRFQHQQAKRAKIDLLEQIKAPNR